MKNKINPIVYLFFLLFWIATTNCGFALTPRITTRIPPKTETEVFRLNLLYGELENLAGLNVGIFNMVDRMIGGQIGIVNYSPKKTYGAQVAVVNIASDKGAGIQAGIVNYSEGDSRGLQAGIVNIGNKRTGFDLTIGAGNYDTKGLMIGAFNFYSTGVNIGILNEKASGFNLGALNIKGGGVNVGILNGGTGVHIGLINASGEEETDEPTIQFGFLNFCGKGTFPVMIGFNYCK
ncbi:hypothetical protein M9Y82_02735 [Leptospira weilii]|uniref:PPE family protein n=1 Tax=Leptospira weilii str. 2006001855 TaxID=996804 RepID=M6FSY3_9LEPT|nr:hypothetical protein [Leptospira weilii]EMM73199.1 hypothetical protein LEP1GSC038_1384 [Leptospira weilii str. 2006001855]MCL8265583.1 hypothetical protein [Leptospira weilii]